MKDESRYRHPMEQEVIRGIRDQLQQLEEDRELSTMLRQPIDLQLDLFDQMKQKEEQMDDQQLLSGSL